jgi:hypothetical protein
MLRLETLDVALSPATGGDISPDRLSTGLQAEGPVTLPPTLIARALGDMIASRSPDGAASFAIEQFCSALTDDAPQRAMAVVTRLLDCGVSIDAIYETYIPRAAARLGDLWLDDRIGFTGVTLGMARLTEVFRSLSPQYLRCRSEGPMVGKPRAAAPSRRRALFALAPGEEHALGVVMAADQFQRAGWAVRVELRSDASGLARIVRERTFDVVGLSAGSRRMIPALRDTVRRMRDAAGPGTAFVLGGPLVALEPRIAEACGFDVAGNTATDILERLDGTDQGSTNGPDQGG